MGRTSRARTQQLKALRAYERDLGPDPYRDSPRPTAGPEIAARLNRLATVFHFPNYVTSSGLPSNSSRSGGKPSEVRPADLR